LGPTSKATCQQQSYSTALVQGASARTDIAYAFREVDPVTQRSVPANAAKTPTTTWKILRNELII